MRTGMTIAGAMLVWAAAVRADPQGQANEAPGPIVVQEVPPPSNNYALGPDSLPHPEVPAGKTFSFEMADPKSFPGTVRNISVYIPAQYHAEKPACVYVGLDGLGHHVQAVFDNLIAQHAMPVTIAIGISSGTVSSAKPPENPRFDRSFEFDSMTDRLARFILEEVFPAVEKHSTTTGEKILLSGDGNDRAIGGGSTGAIAAFTVAWQRPDAFRRIFSSIGTFVGMRGGETYYVEVRKTEPKPLRIFMQDGVHDEWPGGPEMGDWWMSNQTMERALEYAGYDVRHSWGAGTHNGQHADAIFPEAMRWLWRDYPKAIQALEPGNQVLKGILKPHEGWQIVADHCSTAGALAANSKGEIFLPEAGSGRTPIKVVDGKPGKCPSGISQSVLAFGANGQSYAAEGNLEIKTYAGGGKGRVMAKGIQPSSMTVRADGDVYATTAAGEVWRVRANGEKVKLDSGLKEPSGLAFSPDGLWLFVAQSHSRWGYSYRVRSDGTLDSKEPFYDFAVPNQADDSGARAIWMDRSGYAYVATRMGVQIFDRNGRVAGILPMPGNEAAASLCFGGENFNTLYVLSSGKIYKRELHSAGAPPWLEPIKLPKWGAG